MSAVASGILALLLVCTTSIYARARADGGANPPPGARVRVSAPDLTPRRLVGTVGSITSDTLDSITDAERNIGLSLPLSRIELSAPPGPGSTLSRE